MKIVLQVTSASNSFSFEHHGPMIRIGRDPKVELSFTGDSHQAVSWHHARIDLNPDGAILSDLGSTNGTLLNDHRIPGRVPLKRGDIVRLGYTGPEFKVVELSVAPLSSTNPSPFQETQDSSGQLFYQPGRKELRTLIATVVGGVFVLTSLVVVILWLSLKRPAPPPESDSLAKTTVPPVTPGPSKSGQQAESPRGKENPVAAPPDKKQAEPSPAVVVPHPELPAANLPKSLGVYLKRDKDPPSILLQRQRDTDPWGRLLADARLQPDVYLLSLPGCRSRLLLNSGVWLELWGTLPEFGNNVPLFESRVVLHAPAPGFDADFTLDRGRVRLLSGTPKGPARVRVKFLQEQWDVDLAGSQSEVVVESFGRYRPEAPFSKDGSGPGPEKLVGLFVKGKALLHIRGADLELGNLQFVTWSSYQRLVTPPRTFPEQPPWWTDQLRFSDAPLLQRLGLAIEELDRDLAKPETSVLAFIRNNLVYDSPSQETQYLGLHCLAALDALPHLVEALSDRKSGHVRTSAISALRRWAADRPQHDLELYRALQDQERNSREDAERIMQLLHDLPPESLQRPETFQQLIDDLGHPNIAIRQLALAQLNFWVPEGKDIIFDPATDAAGRLDAIARWKKILQPGTLPSTLRQP